MSYARQMLDTYSRTFNVDAGLLAAAIDALSDCVQACNADNAADLSEPNVTEMVTCIRLCLDCVDVCAATAGVIGRQTDYDANVARPLLEACVAICKSCGDECERHAHMPHCRICAEACRRCEQACQRTPGRHEIAFGGRWLLGSGMSSGRVGLWCRGCGRPACGSVSPGSTGCGG